MESHLWLCELLKMTATIPVTQAIITNVTTVTPGVIDANNRTRVGYVLSAVVSIRKCY